MQNEELPSYSYEYANGSANVFSFKTTNNVLYEVRFRPNSEYVSPDEPWRDDFYELIIIVASAPDPNRIPADRIIFPTIVAIITDFFTVHERIILYICDDSDSKELARKRKFDGWYARLGSPLFQRYDLPTVGFGGGRYFASVFFRRDNPYRFAVIATFERLATGEK